MKTWPIIILAVLAVQAPRVYAANLPPGFFEEEVATVAAATALTVLPDGRVLVCEKTGSLRVIKNGYLLPQPFVTLDVNTDGRRGLLGVAADPDFAHHPYVYLYYTAITPLVHNRVSRFKAMGDIALAGTEREVIDLEPLNSTVQNGGSLHFGPDGKLYVGVGDNAVGTKAQDKGSSAGKLLRLEADGAIPQDNPFYIQLKGASRAIFCLGLRNPISFNFQARSGLLYINDVGQRHWQEIDPGAPGANFGWPDTEGDFDPKAYPDYAEPVYRYQSGDGTANCAALGGAFYDPLVARFPAAYQQKYFFGDRCGGWIRQLDAQTHQAGDFATDVGPLSDLTVDRQTGALLYCRSDGAVLRITYEGLGSGVPSLPVKPLDGAPAP